MNVCAFVLIAVGVCVNSRSCLYVLHTRGANTQKCKRYIQQGNSERPRASPPNTCAHTHTHRPPSQIIPLIIEFLIDSRWTKTSSAFKLIGLVDFSPTEGNRRWSWHWKRGLQVMSWWAQVTFCSHFQLWERELLNSPGRTGNWNNKLLERKWNFDTATRFVRLANDLAPFWAVYLCTLAGFGQTEKCRPPPPPPPPATYTLTPTPRHKRGFMEASGDTLWTGFGRFTDMCGLKLAQLENAFHPCAHPSLNVHSSPAVSFISSSDLSWLSGPPASTQHTARSPHTTASYCKTS